MADNEQDRKDPKVIATVTIHYTELKDILTRLATITVHAEVEYVDGPAPQGCYDGVRVLLYRDEWK